MICLTVVEKSEGPDWTYSINSVLGANFCRGVPPRRCKPVDPDTPFGIVRSIRRRRTPVEILFTVFGVPLRSPIDKVTVQEKLLQFIFGR